MSVIIKFNPSAFKHGITEDAIRQAVINVVYDDIWDNLEDKHLLEVMYNVIDEKSVNIFHAMKCRSIYYHLLNS